MTNVCQTHYQWWSRQMPLVLCWQASPLHLMRIQLEWNWLSPICDRSRVCIHSAQSFLGVAGHLSFQTFSPSMFRLLKRAPIATFYTFEYVNWGLISISALSIQRVQTLCSHSKKENGWRASWSRLIIWGHDKSWLTLHTDDKKHLTGTKKWRTKN